MTDTADKVIQGLIAFCGSALAMRYVFEWSAVGSLMLATGVGFLYGRSFE